jgi:anti-sigma B factor antagonist
MGIKTRDVSGVTVVDVDGKLVIGGLAPSTTVQRLLESGVRQIVLNLGGVGYCDSSGIAELVRSEKAVRSAGATLKLAAVPDSVQRMLNTTGLSAGLQIFNDEIDALASFRG